jgi:leucyl-tRNA synthetase
VNWDPVDMTVLANEQVIDGRGWRSGALSSGASSTSGFSRSRLRDELLDGLGTLDQWPDKVRLMQENWIGKSQGMRFRFEICAPAKAGAQPGSDRLLLSQEHKDLEVFTTGPIPFSEASFVAISPDHPIALELAAKDETVAAFIAECKRGGTTAAELETAEKKGFDTGIFVIHPLDPEWKLPLYIANFVLMDYGTGAIFGVPAHDQRDFEFASKYGLPINRVVAPSAEEAGEPIEGEAFTGGGVIVNSRFLNGMEVEAAKAEIIRRAEAEGWGEGTTVWRLRDWGVSRQRYWGTPIPIIHCEACGSGRRSEGSDPASPRTSLRRRAIRWTRTPTGQGECPRCGPPRAGDDTLDTFVDSAGTSSASQPAGDRARSTREAESWLP